MQYSGITITHQQEARYDHRKQGAGGLHSARSGAPAPLHRPGHFDLELEKIFGSAWIYVGHESQVKNAGDLLRHAESARSRCSWCAMPRARCNCCTISAPIAARSSWPRRRGSHIGVSLLLSRLDLSPRWPPQSGAAAAWTIPPHFDAKESRVRACAALPRVASYRGFVFGSLAADGPSLTDYLGYMTTSFDDMVDRAPDGELEVAGGMFKHTYKANWKLYLENLCDAAHPLFTHQSSIDAASQQSDDVHSDGSGEIAIRQMRQNGAPYSFWEANVGIWTYPNGHSFLGDYHDDAKLVAALNDPGFRDYIAAMEARQGKERTKKILELRRWNSNVYPNLSFMSQFGQLRVVHPVSVNETVVHTYCFRLRGAPARMFENAISFANIVNGTGLAGADRRSRNLQSHRAWPFERRPGMARDRSRLSGRLPATSTAAVAARTRPARSTSATCSMPGSATWRKTRTERAARPAERRAPAPRCGNDRRARSSSAWARRAVGSKRPRSCSECEQFLVHEARLLDEARFDEWLRLFTPDAWYWVPAQPDQASPRDTISLIYDDRRLLETRVRRLASPRIYSQEPRSRTSRIVANVTVEETRRTATPAPYAPNSSSWNIAERRSGCSAARVSIASSRTENGIQIAWKRVDLVNCDAPHEGLVVPF